LVYLEFFFYLNTKLLVFRTWSARRKHTKEQKRQQLERPALPESVKLISFPVPNGSKFLVVRAHQLNEKMYQWYLMTTTEFQLEALKVAKEGAKSTS